MAIINAYQKAVVIGTTSVVQGIIKINLILLYCYNNFQLQFPKWKIYCKWT